MLQTNNNGNENDDVILENDSNADKMKDICVEKTSLQKTLSSGDTSVKFEFSKTNKNENSGITEDIQKKNETQKNKCDRKIVSEMSRGIKSKYGASFHNKSTFNKSKNPLSKRKYVPVSNHLTNASAKVVLFERNVEIKDLESKVKYLQNRIKELENENRTLQNIQSRQERELKKCKEGVADIPSLLRSHKEETKVYESTISNIRRELRDCQKELKFRNEGFLKKDSQIDRLNVNLKWNEKLVHDFSFEIKELKASKKELEEEKKLLSGTNENLKTENDGLRKTVKDLLCKVQNIEENLRKESDLNKHLKEDLEKLQDKYAAEKEKVSTEQHILNSEEQVNPDTVKDDSDIVITEKPPLDDLENESEKPGNLVIAETVEKFPQRENMIDKMKDVLIHTHKHHESYHNSKSNKSDSGPFRAGASNLKLLPPLKAHSGKLSQTVVSDLGNIECFSSPADVNLKGRIKYNQYEELAKDFHSKLTSDDNEMDKSENETTLIFTFTTSNNVKNKEKPDNFGESSKNDNKYWQNEEFINDIHHNRTNYTNENDRLESRMTVSRDFAKKEKHGSFGETHPNRITDTNEHDQLESRMTMSKDLARKEKHGCLGEPHYNRTTDTNEYDQLENRMTVSRDLAKKEKHGCFGEPHHNRTTDTNEYDQLENRMTVSRDLGKKEKHGGFDELIKDTSKYWHSENLVKDSQCQLKADSNKMDRFENKISVSSNYYTSDLMRKVKHNCNSELFKDGCKSLQCEGLEKDVECNQNAEATETHTIESKTAVSRNLMKQGKHTNFDDSFNNDSKHSQNGDLVKHIQCKPRISVDEAVRPENKSTLSRDLMKEKHDESSKDGSKYLSNKDIVKDFQCRGRTENYETNNSKNRLSFLKHKIGRYSFLQSPKQNNSESDKQLSWWNNW